MTDRQSAPMTMVGEWMLTRVDGENPDGYRWIEGGAGPEPDWTWFDEDDYPEPVEVLAEQFVPTYVKFGDCHWHFTRRVRRRWFGLTEHEWNDDDESPVCMICDLVRAAVMPPWDEHCRPETP